MAVVFDVGDGVAAGVGVAALGEGVGGELLVAEGGFECKDLSGAMTAAEIAREMSQHFRAVGSTSLTKHAERVAWLTARTPAALELLGLGSAAEEWSVRGLFVTSRPVHAPYIEDVGFPIVPLNRLVAHLRNAA